MYVAFCTDCFLFRFLLKWFFLADPQNHRKRPDSHESMANAVGVLDFPRKSFVQITGRVYLSFSLSPFVVRNILWKKELRNLPYLRAILYDFADSWENVLSVVKSKKGDELVNGFCRKLFQILRKFAFNTYKKIIDKTKNYFCSILK